MSKDTVVASASAGEAQSGGTGTGSLEIRPFLDRPENPDGAVVRRGSKFTVTETHLSEGCPIRRAALVRRLNERGCELIFFRFLF